MKTTRGSSRGRQEPPAGSSSRGGSRGPASAYSVPALRLSSRTERTIGGLFVPPVPVIISGPSVYASLTSARIYWELDPEGAAGFHRIRWKADLGDDWTTEDWTGEAGFSASIWLYNLDPERQDYWAEAQSGAVTDNEDTWTDWAALDPAYFYTTCSEDWGMSGWNASKEGGGKLYYLVLSWDSDVVQYYAYIDGQAPLDDAAWASTGPHHSKTYHDWDFSKAGTYWWRTRHRNKCFTYGTWSEWKYFKVSGAGVIYEQG